MSIHAGILLPAETLQTGWFQALATFVAINTLVYATLALGKDHPAPSGMTIKRIGLRGCLRRRSRTRAALHDDHDRGRLTSSANSRKGSAPLGGAEPFAILDVAEAQRISSKILKIGMYSAMTMKPTMPPRNSIITGSTSVVSASVVASTSWS